MLKRIKKILGIEGVKIKLELDENPDLENHIISGKIRFTSKESQKVNRLNLKVIEKFSRGRKTNKLIDEYTLGEVAFEMDLTVGPDQEEIYEFKLPFQRLKSEMDEMQDSNFVMKGVVKSLKWLSKVKSEFKVVAQANVEGTTLNPFSEQKVVL